MCIKHVGIINKVAWNIRNYRYVGDVSTVIELDFIGIIIIIIIIISTTDTVISTAAPRLRCNI